MIEVKDIKDLVIEYLDNKMSIDIRYHREWPSIAGDYLRRVTSFVRLDGSVICINASGSAARNRIMLEKRRIIAEFNRRFPSAGADDIRIVMFS